MGWDIPNQINLQPIKRPFYFLWVIALIIIMGLGFILTVLFYKNDNNDDSPFWFFSIFLPFSFWFFLFIFRHMYFFHTYVKNKTIDEVNQEWKDWSRAQIPIFGQHIICAEADVINALVPGNIPLFPQKARPLFNQTASNKPFWFLDEVMVNLAKQSPNYRKYLTHIYLPQALFSDEALLDAIFLRWELKPEPIHDHAAFIDKMHNNPDDIKLSLILVCQYDDSAYRNHSKFISAMLMGSETAYINKAGLQANSQLGRIMKTKPSTLLADIEQLLNYTKVPPENLKEIWISGLNQQIRTELTLITHQLGMGYRGKVHFHDIDLTFAKPSALTKYFMLATASAKGIYVHHQLAVYIDDYDLYLQLISYKKFK